MLLVVDAGVEAQRVGGVGALLRAAGDAQLARLEAEVLARVLQQPLNPDLPEIVQPLPTQLRWAY